LKLFFENKFPEFQSLVARGELSRKELFMLKIRREAADQVAQKLFALEAAIDEALICAGELAATVPAARKHAKLSAVVGQEAVDLTGATLAALIEARQNIVAAHGAFADVHTQIGLKVYATGALWKFADITEPPLALVSSRAA
jgi:hypothetical protein